MVRRGGYLKGGDCVSASIAGAQVVVTPEILTKLAEVSDWEAIVEEEPAALCLGRRQCPLRTRVPITIDRVAGKVIVGPSKPPDAGSRRLFAWRAGEVGPGGCEEALGAHGPANLDAGA